MTPKRVFKNPIWGLGSFQALAMFRRGLFYTFLSIYLNGYLGLSVTATTLYATIPMILSVIGQNFIWGPISDKFQRRRALIIIGEVIAGVLLILVWYLHTIPINAVPSSKIIAGWIVIGGLTIIELFWSMSNIGWSALVSDLYPSKKRSIIMGWLNSIGGIGRIIGAFLGGFLYDYYGSEYEGWGFEKGALFIVASFIMFISTIPMIFTREGARSTNAENKNDIMEENPNLNIDKRVIRKIFTIFIISLIFINFGRNSIATLQSQYLTLDTGYDVTPITLSVISIVRSIAVILFGLIAGWICRKIGEDTAILLGSSIGVAALIVYGMPVSLDFIYAANVGLGMSELIVYAASYTYASKLIPYEKRARLFALYNATFFLSWGLSGTLIVGPFVDLLKKFYSDVFSYQMGFLVAAGITLVGFAIFLGLLVYTQKIKIRKEIHNLF